MAVDRNAVRTLIAGSFFRLNLEEEIKNYSISYVAKEVPVEDIINLYINPTIQLYFIILDKIEKDLLIEVENFERWEEWECETTIEEDKIEVQLLLREHKAILKEIKEKALEDLKEILKEFKERKRKEKEEEEDW